MEKVKAGIIGASGYAGAELVRILMNHPQVDLVGINARSYLGQPISELYPGFYQACDMVFEDADEVIAKSDVIFTALPHGASEAFAVKCTGKKIIDLGADFRLDEEADYQEWYNLPYQHKELHTESVYGLSEIHREQIKNARIIGNPGCYPTSISLGSYPALKNGIVDGTHVIIDSKSGVTGAGKGLSDNTHFPKTNESFAPYKAGVHRHTPEIEQMLSEMAQEKVMVTFVPHLLPLNRGIISTMYYPLKKKMTLEEVHQIYVDTYKNEKFVRILPLGKYADLKFVQYSNYCNISLHMDERNSTLIIVACIDNMVKGAAGQAVQNMNIMFGLEEDCGLNMIAPSF